MMILKNKLFGSAARLGRGFQTRPYLCCCRTIKPQGLHALGGGGGGGFHGETSDLFPRWVFLGIRDLAMI